jgi:hypothetical protein
MKKLIFLALFASVNLFANAQTTPKKAAVKKEQSCKPGDACCKKKGDKKSCNMSKEKMSNCKKS